MVVVVHDQPQGVGQGHFPQHRHAEAQHGREVGGWWSRVSVISRQTNAKKRVSSLIIRLILPTYDSWGEPPIAVFSDVSFL